MSKPNKYIFEHVYDHNTREYEGVDYFIEDYCFKVLVLREDNKKVEICALPQRTYSLVWIEDNKEYKDPF